MFTSQWAWPARWPICLLLGFWGAKFTNICDSLPWTPMNRRAKFDAPSFILGEEIRNRTDMYCAAFSDFFLRPTFVGLCCTRSQLLDPA